MGRIQSGIGLITGVPIADTVDQLIALSARPRDLLVQRTNGLGQERVALTELSALVLDIQFALDRLNSKDTFNEKIVSTSNPDVLAAAVAGEPRPGTHYFTPVRQAQSHQLVSSGLSSLDRPLGEGLLSFRFGGFVDQGIALDELNQGEGVERGKLRITDRSGASEIIDLRYALTVDDVLETINANEGVNVTVVTDGDALRLIDNTGQSVANLSVQEIGQGKTAADLGLDGVDVAASAATGQDIVSLHDGVLLDWLNDANGVEIRPELEDLTVTFRDGSSPLGIEFHAAAVPEGKATATTNAANGVNAEITFTAVQTGAEFDDVTVRFIDTGAVTKAGDETVVYDDSDPENKTLTFDINAGKTKAVHIVDALAADPVANSVITAVAGGDGSGKITLADTAVTSGGAAIEAQTETTLGELVETLNAADPIRLHAQISDDGDRLVLTDLTSGSGTFSVTSALGGTVAADLGLTGAAVDGVITGQRLQAGLKTTLIRTLDGGSGLELGLLYLEDRDSNVAIVDLSSAETLDDVIGEMNNAAVGLTVRINDARNGILVMDTTSGTGNLRIANLGGNSVADALGIAVDDAVSAVDGGSLHRQVVSRATRLDSLARGREVSSGSFLITDSHGAVGAVNLAILGATTAGDIIDAVNDLDIGVTAQINDTGDGMLLVDTGGGTRTLHVEDVGNGQAATNLWIAGEASEVDIDGNATQVIDGSMKFTVGIDADDTLPDLVDKINALDGGPTASTLNVGTGSAPYRLSLISDRSGRAGQLSVDVTGTGFTLRDIVAAQDALLLVGSADSPGAGLLISSPTNTLDHVIEGVDLTIQGTSSEPVTVEVSTTDAELASRVDEFVEAYNRLRGRLDELTFFNEFDSTTGILFGTAEALRVETDFARLLTGQFRGVGTIRSLGEIGLSFDGNGHLSFDAETLHAKYAEDPAALEQFLTDQQLGVVAKLNSVTAQLAGEGNSLLVARSDSLQSAIDQNSQRIELLNERLDRQRESLLRQFYAMEEAVSRMQADLNVIASISALPPLTFSSRNI